MRVSLPEQVWLDLAPASFGSRSLAFSVDLLLRWTATLALLFAAGMLVYFGSSFFGDVSVGLSDLMEGFRKLSGQSFGAFAILIIFVVEFCYPLYFDVVHDGVSPGKRLFGLRVVDERGLPITARTSLMRTIFIPVDLFGFGLVAFFSMLLSERSQRLGDLAARTLVVHELEGTTRSESTLSPEAEGAPLLVPLGLYNAVQNYFERRRDLLDRVKSPMLLRMKEALLTVHPELGDPGQDPFSAIEPWLEQHRSRLLPAKQGTRSGVDVTLDWHAIAREFDEFEHVLDGLETVQVANDCKSLDVLFQAVQQYQRLCQRYAYLETFYPKTSQALQAAKLIRRARRVIYGRRPALLRESSDRWLSRVPSVFALIRDHTAVSTGLMISGACIASLFVYLNPNIGWHFINEETAAMLRSGKLWTDEIQGTSAIASSKILTNNIGVTLTAFAMGISAGIGTALILLVNGAMLGGIFMTLTQYDMSWRLFNFVTAHGVLELSVIAVAGGAGLFLGDAILNPGPLTRKAAIQQRTRPVFDLLLFNALCLIVAGIVEGFVSPYPSIPYPVKAIIGLSLGILYWAFLCWGGAKHQAPDGAGGQHSHYPQ
ncbi:MAG: stage II sporulation protein M [Bdellovibrionales bacterium]|nr:stage II sporulation protein M [Bdellovibrionales bacterium]